ncbi:MAG: N-acetyl-gamma-glutamyl-phosphate reductase [Succinivibrio sp.]|nr:N-acetyl-gamma-glutamyl-phosphate reductase [Succinivibrio sp.]
MIKVAIVGASGYTGAELARLVTAHPKLELAGLYVSEHSEDQGKPIADLYGYLYSRCELKLQPLHDAQELSRVAEIVFLCTDHKVSHDLAPQLLALGLTVYDLSGAFRLSNLEVFKQAYGFEHQYPELVKTAVYGLAEYVTAKQLQATSLIALPGCYPTASQLALRPLIDKGLLDPAYRVSINAVSGVSGAGRKSKLSNSFCEVSLNAYGVFTHRHQPEISEHLGQEVIFTPHLGNFKRGILATVTAKLAEDVSAEEAVRCLVDAYAHKPLVRVKSGMPKLMDVVGLPYCDLGISSRDGYVVICSAIDNLLKGAAAQAVQVMNLRCGFAETEGLV